MMKVLLLVAVLLLLLWLLRPRRPSRRDGGGMRAGHEVEDMVCCAHCGVHVPRREAVLAHDETFCSQEHRLAFEAAPPQ